MGAVPWGTRIEFVCGGRALASYRAWRDAAAGAARLISALPRSCRRGRAAAERGEGRAPRGEGAGGKAAGLEAGTLAGRAGRIGAATVFIEAFDDYDVATLKLLAHSFVKEPGRAIVLLTTGTPAQASSCGARI